MQIYRNSFRPVLTSDIFHIVCVPIYKMRVACLFFHFRTSVVQLRDEKVNGRFIITDLTIGSMIDPSTGLYSDKIHTYQANIHMFIGRLPQFQDFYAEFAKQQAGHGLDIGAGPQGASHPFFKHCARLDGCDAEQQVVDSLPSVYQHKFLYRLGSEKPLPYKSGSLDFAICACMIQHLSSWAELVDSMQEIRRVLKKGGELFLVFKCGSNDSLLTHFNPYYGYERTFRVFQPSMVQQLMLTGGYELLKEDRGVDGLYIPYSFMTFRAV